MNTLAAILLAVIMPEFDIVAQAKRDSLSRAVAQVDRKLTTLERSVSALQPRPLTTAQAVTLSRDPQPVRTIQAAPVQQRSVVRRRGFFRRR